VPLETKIDRIEPGVQADEEATGIAATRPARPTTLAAVRDALPPSTRDPWDTSAAPAARPVTTRGLTAVTELGATGCEGFGEDNDDDTSEG